MGNVTGKPKRFDEEDDEIEVIQMGNSGRGMLRVSEQTFKNYLMYLDEAIGAPSKYRDFLSALHMSSQLDTFNVMINSPGGYLSSATAIIESIRQSDASVRGIIMGECHSAASMIALNCDEIFVCDGASMMIHTASYGVGGNTHNVKGHTDFQTVQINKLIDSTYSGFLSQSEIDDVKKGVEIWLDAKQIRKRLEHRVAWLESKQKQPKKSTKTASKTKTPQVDVDVVET